MRNSTTIPNISPVIRYDLISDQELQILVVVNVCAIMGLISAFGTTCNIINIIIFMKQGIQDTTNISLLGIAVADTGALVTLLCNSICLNPLMVKRFEDLEMMEILYLTSTRPHVYFVRVTGWLTALVTIERYLCIAYPLKVRNLITPQRTAVINITVFVILVAYVIPVFTSTSLVKKFSFSKNRTVIGTMQSSDSKTIHDIASYFNTISELSSFVIVAVMTIKLVHKLNDTTKWRHSTSTATKTGNISSRDQRVVRMVIFLSIIFIICYFPVVALFVVMKCEKELSITGKYKNLYLTMGLFVILIQAVNSTANIFVYLRMSSKYREMFFSMFTWTSNKR